MDLTLLGYAIPVLTAILLGLVMSVDRRSRSLATVYLAATVTLGFSELLVSRVLYQVIELAMIAVFVTRLRFVRVIYSPAVLSILAFLGMALVSLAIATVRGANPDAVIGAVVNVTASCLGAAFLLSDARIGPNHGAALKYATIPIALVALSGIYDAVVHPGARVSGIYSNINPFAYMMAVGFILSLHFHRGPLRLLFAALIATALFFTESRAAFLMVGVYCVLRTWWLLRKGAVVPLIATGLIAAVIVTVGAASIIGRYAGGGVTYAHNVDAERRMIVRSATAAIVEHPLAGLGWGQFQHQFRNYGAYRLTTDTYDVDNKGGLFGRRDTLVTHNDFLSVISELGIPFAIVVFLMFLASARFALFGRTSAHQLVLPLFLGNVIYSLSHNSSNSVMFFYLMFLPLAYAPLLKRRAPAANRRAFADSRQSRSTESGPAFAPGHALER
jgi:O-antigen ligase